MNPIQDSNAFSSTQIPHCFHFIHLEERPLFAIEERHFRSWLELHPSWQWKMWTQKTIRALIPELHSKTLTDIQFELINRFGGIAVDASLECVRPLDGLITRYDFFTLPTASPLIIGATPSHPILKDLVQGKHSLLESFSSLKNPTRDALLPLALFAPIPHQTAFIPLDELRKRYIDKAQYTLQLSYKTVEIVVIIPSYNNGKNNNNACLTCLESVRRQNYPHFSVVYIDDASTDDTLELVTDFVRTNNLKGKFSIIHNSTRKGALENYYNSIHSLPKDTVVVNLDGDDSLKDEDVLTTIASHYAEKKSWLTYGTYEPDVGEGHVFCAPVSEEVCKKRLFRKCPWIFSHVRTFYTALFQKINKEDLLFKGEFFSVAWDLAFMYPMLEMASKGHITYIPDILYVYNTQNPLNDYRTNPERTRALEEEIRKKPSYSPLEELF